MRIARTGLIGIALLATTSALAASEDATACTDQDMNRQIKEQYEFSDSIHGGNRKVRDLIDIKEVAPASVTTPQLSQVKIASRYCQATLVLDNGDTDTLYWHIDVIVMGEERRVNYDQCSLRQDPFHDKCAGYRPRN